MDRQLQKYLDTYLLHAPEPLAQTAAAQLWRVCDADGRALVLKIYQHGDASNESAGAEVLRAWHEAGARVVDVVAHGPGFLLMAELFGPLLGETARKGALADADRHLSRLARHLHRVAICAPPGLPDLADWFSSLFDLRFAADCPADLRRDVTCATRMAEQLLAGSDKRPLHGDLHHDNVVVMPDAGCVAIDAKGVMGDPAYELANAMRNPKGCDAALRDAAGQAARIELFARTLDVDPERFARWAAAKCALSIAWSAGPTLRAHKQADVLSVLLSLTEH